VSILERPGPDAGRLRARLAAGQRPYVTLKAAATLDGKIATRGGESRWITGEAARDLGRRLRAAHDGVLVGIGTVLADDPQLTLRGAAAGPEPARIVLDSRCRIAPGARCLAPDGARRIVVAGAQAAPERIARLEAAGVTVLRAESARPEPAWYLPRLLGLGLGSLLVEGGGQVHANLIAQQVADELFLFLAGKVMGDAEAPGWCATLSGSGRLADVPRLRLDAAAMVGADVLVHGCFETG